VAMTQLSSDAVVGPAGARWSDYVGTAAADDALARWNTPSVYTRAGLDRDQWVVVGLDLFLEGGQTAAAVYAVDRAAHQVRTTADLLDLAEERGQVPVQRFEVAPAHVQGFLDDVLGQLSVRLVARPFADIPLVLGP
jgi:hypothetical protein